MKRTGGLWYVKYKGVWLLGGKTLSDALWYKRRMIDHDRILAFLSLEK